MQQGGVKYILLRWMQCTYALPLKPYRYIYLLTSCTFMSKMDNRPSVRLGLFLSLGYIIVTVNFCVFEVFDFPFTGHKNNTAIESGSRYSVTVPYVIEAHHHVATVYTGCGSFNAFVVTST